MNSNWRDKLKTTIHFFYMTFIMVSLVYVTAWAQNGVDIRGGGPDPLKACEKNHTVGSPEYINCIKQIQDALSGKDNSARCDKLADDVNKGLEAQMRACGGYTKGSDKNCYEKVKKCADAKNDVDAYAQFAEILGMSKSETIACTYSPKDYETKRKDTEREISDLDKDIRDAEKDLNKLEADYLKSVEKLQEALVKEQEAFDKLNEDLEDQYMKEESAALEEDQKANRRLAQLQKQKMELRQKLVESSMLAQAELLQVSDKIANSECIMQVKKYKKENIKILNNKSSGDHIRTAKAIKEELNARYDACMSAMSTRREAIAHKLKTTTDSIRHDLEQTDKEIQNLQQIVENSARQRQMRIAKMNEKKQKAIKRAAEKTQRLQANLQDQQKNTQNERLSLQKRAMTLNQKRNMLTATLNSMGIVDGDRSNNKSLEDLITSANSAKEIAKRYVSTCCEGAGGTEKSLCDRYKEFANSTLPVPASNTGRR